MARDNGKCQACGTRKDLHAHHIKPVREFDNREDAHFAANLVILCKSCHRKWEGRRERPRLAIADDGVTVNEVAHDLASDTVRRLAVPASLPEIFMLWMKYNPGVCFKCLRMAQNKGRYPDFRRLHQIIRLVTENRDPSIDTRPIRLRLKKYRCGHCSFPGNAKSTQDRNARYFCRILNKCGIHISEDDLRTEHLENNGFSKRLQFPRQLFRSMTEVLSGKHFDNLEMTPGHYEKHFDIEDNWPGPEKSKEEEYREWFESQPEFDT